MRVAVRPPSRRSSSPFSRRRCSSASSRRPPPSASDPPGLARFMYALGRGRVRRQLHRPEPDVRRVRQVPDHAVELARHGPSRYLGDPNARPTPANQEIVATAKVTALYSWLEQLATRRLLVADRARAGPAAGRPTRRATWPGSWPTTPSAAPSDIAGPPATGSGARPALLGGEPRRSPTARRGGRRRTRGYAGGAVRYATKAGAKATFTFNGSRDHLVRTGRTDPRPGPGLHRRQAASGRSTCTAARSPLARRCSARPGPRPASTRSPSRSSGPPAIRWSRSTSSSSAARRRAVSARR